MKKADYFLLKPLQKSVWRCVLVFTSLVAVSCASASTHISSSSASAQLVTLASTSTNGEGSAAFDLVVAETGYAPAELSGVYDFTKNIGSGTSNSKPAAKYLFFGDTVYVQNEVPSGGWTEHQLAQTGKPLDDVSALNIPSFQPSSLLNELKIGLENFSSIGVKTIRGVSTTEHSGTLNFGALGYGNISPSNGTFYMYLDSSNRIRRLEFPVPRLPGTMITIDYFSFGLPVTVVRPSNISQ